MIQELKQRLSKYYLFLVVSLFLPLVGFFFYAIHWHLQFFFFLSAALAVNLLILISFHHRLKRKRAVVKLQREEFFEKANLIRSDLQNEETAIAAFREKIVKYSQLKGLAEKLANCLTLEETGLALSREVTNLLPESQATVLLYMFESQSGDLAIVHAARNHHPINIKAKQGDIFDRWVIKMLQPLLLEDAHSDFRFDLDKMSDEESRPIGSVLSVPLLVLNKMVGILRLDAPAPRAFSSEDLRFLRAIGDMAAVAIENAQLYDHVEDLAIRDGLTGLYLRRYLTERLVEESARHLRKEKEMSLVMLDLDHFKRYNDQFGHTAGDILLKHFSALIQAHFHEPGNLLCRYGGEEFCVLLAECSKEEATALARDFVLLVERQNVILRRESTSITVSAGVACFPRDAKTREDLFQKADDALYQAKRKGRNRVCVA